MSYNVFYNTLAFHGLALYKKFQYDSKYYPNVWQIVSDYNEQT